MSGWTGPEAKLTVKTETVVSLLIKPENSMGQVVAYKVMERCIKKVEISHIGSAAATNSNHIGIADYYAMITPKHDMIGPCMTNVWSLRSNFWYETNTWNNPIASALPAKHEHPFVLDMAASVVHVGTMEVYQRHRKPVPVGWAINEDGDPATHSDRNALHRQVKRWRTDASGRIRGTAGYKAYGLSLLVDTLSGISPGGAYGALVGSTEDPKPSNIGNFMGDLAQKLDLEFCL